MIPDDLRWAAESVSWLRFPVKASAQRGSSYKRVGLKIFQLRIIVWERLGQLTLQSDLPAGPVRRHAGLAGPLVGSVLQTNHRLSRLQNVVVKVPLVLTGHLQVMKSKMS